MAIKKTIFSQYEYDQENKQYKNGEQDGLYRLRMILLTFLPSKKKYSVSGG